MKISIALIASALILSGCAHCQMTSFYKPSTSGDSRLRIESGAPNYVSFMLGDVSFTALICGDRYLAPPAETVTFCLSLELDETTTLRFTEPSMRLGAGLSRPKVISMTSVEYERICKIEKGERKCTSTEQSPVVGGVKKISTASAVDRFAFDPSLEFRGAKDTLHEGSWFGHRLTGKRRYYILTASVVVQQGAELSAQLPNVIINGKAFTPPELNFRAVTEEVCRMVPLA